MFANILSGINILPKKNEQITDTNTTNPAIFAVFGIVVALIIVTVLISRK